MTQVTLKFTGEVWSRVNTYQMGFAFEGRNLGDLLNAFFVQHRVRDLLLDEHDKIIPWSRVIVNGKFSETMGDLAIPIHNGDEVVLVRPFVLM
ncbi:MAG: hypothetical protein HY868_16105 [Chloroflexi bacterium]|nr:hypothetical protein [Chloroflexota bacterium]